MQIAFVLYPKFTALDVIGPFQVLAYGPGHEPVIVAAEPGSVPDDTGRCAVVATAALDDVTSPDIVVIPGSLYDDDPAYQNPYGLADERIVDWLRQVHATTTWTTSVCTGSIFLAAAGILDGIEATTHWSRAEHLERLGARYLAQRVVERGKIMTAAGVSSGIDMALTLTARLHGPEVAQALQLAIEYDPQPPFDAGSPSKAPAELVPFVRASLRPWTNDESLATS